MKKCTMCGKKGKLHGFRIGNEKITVCDNCKGPFLKKRKKQAPMSSKAPKQTREYLQDVKHAKKSWIK